jgi:hypothetical protein
MASQQKEGEGGIEGVAQSEKTSEANQKAQRRINFEVDR